MSEETKKISAFKLFAQAQQTYAEAEEKAKSEAGKPKVERFRIGEDGDYSVRIMPLAPVLDAEGNPLPMDRKGYEYPIHQLFLGITLPIKKKGQKAKKINIPVIRATDKGVDKSVDLIDTYVKIAKEMYADDEELLNVVTGGSFGGGLRWSYQHAMMVLDLTSDKTRAKGPQLWQCSHAQYKDIDAAKMRLWAELREEEEGQDTCPISWFTDAYPIKVIRKTEQKTEYTIEIGRKVVDIKEEEVEKLLDLPRIPELVNRFTRYQLEAEIVFLQQYDELHDMEVCKEPDFLEAIETLKGEMPADDTSHFDLASAGTSESSSSAEVTIDSLWDEFDSLEDAGADKKSPEYQELLENIRQFAEDNDLDVRLSRSKTAKQMLEEIEEALDAKKSDAAPAPKKEAKKPAPKVEEPEDDEDDDVEDEDDAEDAEETQEPEPEPAPRRRRPRPTATEEPEDEPEAPAKEEADEEAEEEAEERPLHRRRRR